MRTEQGNDIFEVIRNHVGRDNAIHASEICAQLGWPETFERNARKLISEQMHEWPVILCAVAGDGGGYFVAETYLEIEAYWAHLADLAAVAIEKVERFEWLCHNQGIRVGDRGAKKAA